MSIFGEAIGSVVTSVTGAVTGVINKKTDRKIAHDAASAALNQAQISDAHDVTVNDQHLETILAQNQTTTWRDEYVTISLIGIINAVVIGGILQGFGHPAFLQGVLIGVNTLSQIIDLKWGMDAAIASSLGYSIWRKI